MIRYSPFSFLLSAPAKPALTEFLTSAFGIAVSGGVLIALIGVGFGEVTASTALALFLAYLFGGYIGGKLGEPSEPAMRHLDN